MAKVQGKTSQNGRQKRKKKPGPDDSIRAVLISSIFIGLAVFLSIILIVFLYPKESPPAEITTEPITAAPVETTPAEVAPIETVPAETVPTETVPAETVPLNPQQKPADQSIGTKPAKGTNLKPSGTPNLPSPLKGGSGLVVSAPIERPPQPPPRRKGSLAIVLDDAGNNLKELDPFLKFPGPLTIAVLPGLPYSAEAAKRIRAAGKEVILHQPMEAVGGQNPGPGAIYSDMTQEEIEAVLKKNLAQVGPVVGMNNHQGSKITADERIMEIVLAFCRRNGIYYLDSRTTAETAVPAVAERMGIRIGERDVFVDNIQEKAAMIRFMEEGLQKAEKKGAAIVIGHVWSNELAATLSELYPELIAQGFSLTTVSRIMMGTFEDEGFGD